MDEIFYRRTLKDTGATLIATAHFDNEAFGSRNGKPSPFTVSITHEGRDIGRMVGYEGDGATIIAMHGLKPDIDATRAVELTVFRVGDILRETHDDVNVLGAFERWLLKRGWRGNILKKLKFTADEQVVPIRTFWVKQGYELALAQDGKWDEHVIKRWR